MLEQNAVFSQVSFVEGAYGPLNGGISRLMLPTLNCPTDGVVVAGASNYAGCFSGEDVAIDTAHTRCCTLVWFNGARVIVAFDLERACPAVTDVDQSGVLLPRLGQQLRAAPWQGLQLLDGILVRAMLAPHDGKNAQPAQENTSN